jgi:hypothetical protein
MHRYRPFSAPMRSWLPGVSLWRTRGRAVARFVLLPLA